MLLVGAIAFMASTCQADFSAFGGGGAISDGGTPLVRTTPNITQDETITGLDVVIHDMNHTWVGDLVVSLTHVTTGEVVPLFNRVDRFPTSGPGDSSNLLGTYRFSDSGADFWTEAGNGTSSYELNSAQAYEASDVGGNPVSLDAAFGGESTAGTWRLSVTDADEKETGSYASFELRFRTANAIPEPSSMGLIALSLIGGAIYRRRKN